MSKFRVRNEFAAVDVSLEEVPWGSVLAITDARTGLSIRLDALEVEALTSLSQREREVLVNRSAGSLRRNHLRSEGGGGSDS
jgi:hypothetical protein